MHPNSTLSRSLATSRLTLGLASRAALAVLAATLLAAHSAYGSQLLPVGDNSFETPSGAINQPEDVIPGAPSPWTQSAQPSYYANFILGGAPAWNQAVGVFGNTPSGASDHINNIDGTQAGYILNFQGNALSQNLTTNYTVGTPYSMTVNLIAGSGVASDDSMDLIFYYQSGGNMISLGDTTVTPSSFTHPGDLNDFQSFSVSIPAVPAGSPEAGTPIGIEMVVSNGVEGGFWDVDNVQVVPEPATIGLLALGFGALGWRRRRAGC